MSLSSGGDLNVTGAITNFASTINVTGGECINIKINRRWVTDYFINAKRQMVLLIHFGDLKSYFVEIMMVKQ